MVSSVRPLLYGIEIPNIIHRFIYFSLKRIDCGLDYADSTRRRTFPCRNPAYVNIRMGINADLS
jgi:hypothetical protein